MDRTEFTRLTTKYLPAVYKTALCNCRNTQDAEDIVQETFCALLNSGQSFPDDESVKRWLLRVAVNKSRDLFRSAWRRKTVSLEEAADAADGSAPLSSEETDLFRALQQLPIKYRNVLHLFYYEEYSTREIAQILQISEGTVRTRLSRARKKLQQILKEA